ncbi:hypothetical protein B7P43_G16202 [Cryptotermes secundus]|uniref:Uncharacterized protein n=1 Tax=Cryptotermes secundus TaxID=105785 RepID=A0A2J7PPL8_9NEOP|nr:hypothetical protein B7P43_G16202 [Cryptotermes secundus]
MRWVTLPRMVWLATGMRTLRNYLYLSHKFHGKGPGRNKIEKRMKKNEQEGLMKQMTSTHPTWNALGLAAGTERNMLHSWSLVTVNKYEYAFCLPLIQFIQKNSQI